MMHQESADQLHKLPIDISFSKLSDWLVDRRKIPLDWRKKLALIRSRITTSLLDLPKNVDPWLSSLVPETTGYLEAKKVLEILVRSNPDAKNLFGKLSGSAGEWDAIVRAYEKDFLYLAEAAQVMTQNVNYEIPLQKKQVAKLQQQLADLERKETEYKRNAAASALKYTQACQEMGILGKNVKFELVEKAKSLPGIFGDVIHEICSMSIGQALEYYETFVNYAHGNEEAGTICVLETLQEIRANPENYTFQESFNEKMPANLHKAASPGSVDTLCATDMTDSAQLVEGAKSPETSLLDQECKPSAYNIDTANLENGDGNALEETAEIRWDIDLEDTSSLTAEDVHENNGISYDSADNVTEIIWDIGVEDGTSATDIHQGEGLVGQHSANQEKVALTGGLADGAYRNKLLDDLYEIKAFLNQRLHELKNSEASALQNQAQSIAPGIGVDSITLMVEDVNKVLHLLTNRTTRELIMISTSPKMLDRLVGSISEKQQNETKSLEALKDLSQKRLELRSSLSSLWPKQEALIARTQQVKRLVEEVLSSQYDGRPVNIIGEINTILGLA